MKYNENKKSRGFSLPEMIVYVAILTLLLVVIVSMLSNLTSSQRQLKASKNIENSAIFGFDRMVRETRDARSIDTVSSIFGINPGSLSLLTTDTLGNSKTLRFYLLGNSLRVSENGADQGPLTPADARVTSLIFRQITTANSSAVKIEMTVESGAGDFLKSEEFSTTAVLRGSY